MKSKSLLAFLTVALVVLVATGCAFFRGAADQVRGVSPIQAEVEKVISELEQAYQKFLEAKAQYEQLKAAYDKAAADGVSTPEALALMMSAANAAAERYEQARDLVMSLLEQKRLIEIKAAETGNDWVYNAGAFVGGILSFWMAQQAARRTKKAKA